MKVQRILLIQQFLKLGPETIDSIHQKLKKNGIQCSKRSVYRDLLSLEEHFEDQRMELKVVDGEFNRKKWLIVRKKTDNQTKEETYFKTFMVEYLKPNWMKKLTGNTLDTLLRSDYTIKSNEFHTLASNLPIGSILHSGWGELQEPVLNPDFLRDILWAITNQKVIVIRQPLHHELITYRFAPFRILYHRGTLQLCGWELDEKNRNRGFTTREVDLFEHLEVTNQRFLPKGELREAKQLLSTRFGIHDVQEKKPVKIKLELGEGPARFMMRRNWHPTQKFYQDKQGRWFMEMNCALSIELVGWLFGWVEHLKVIQPVALRRQMQERAEYIAKMYKKDLPPVNPKNTNDPDLIGA
jgi:predicted DNA-binding transcriptional regulator YafY